MKFIGLLDKYRINKKLEDEIEHGQGIYGKIIEKELEDIVKDKEISGLMLESNIGLHTLRINLGKYGEVGENDLVIHMAKESLRAFEMRYEKRNDKGISNKGIIVKFKEKIGTEICDKVDEEYELDLRSLEKGFSERAVNSVGRIINELHFRDIHRVFPSWYYEDWVQIHTNNSLFLIRIDPKCLYGIGIGRISNSSINANEKDDKIFVWENYIDHNISKAYYKSRAGYALYEGSNKVKIFKKELSQE